MEPQTGGDQNVAPITPNIESKESFVASANKVTSFSKILAAVLFIVLPFVGMYVGYMYGVEQSTEKHNNIATQTVTNPNPVISEVAPINQDASVMEETTSELIDTAANLRVFTDNEARISFQYPENWGEVVTDVYEGVCSDGTVPCLSYTYSFMNNGGQYEFFLSLQKNGFSVKEGDGRGVYWGDYAHLVDGEYLNVCAASSECTVITNDNGLQIASYLTDISYYDDTTSNLDYLYQIHNASQGVGILLSSERLPPEVVKSFEDTVVKSLSVF